MNIAIKIARQDALTLNVDTDELLDSVKDFIFTYGLRQILNDAGASMKTPDEKFAAAEAKLARLYSGELRVARESADPVEVEITKMVRAQVHARIRAAGKKLKEYEGTDALEGAYAKYRAANEAALMEAARAAIAARKDAAKNAVGDLDDLGL